MVYEECDKCRAKGWCKIYSGEVPKGRNPWCSAKYRLDSALALSNIPRAYLKANLYNYDIDSENKALSNLLEMAVNDIVSLVEQGTNFFFWGSNPGTGKTYSAFVLLNHFTYKSCLTKQFDFEKPLGLYVAHSDLMDDLRYRRELDRVQDLLQKISEVPLLIIDDIGSGTSSTFSRDQTFLIINARMMNGLSTIYTSNLTAKELRDPNILGSRTVSRMMSNSFGMEFKGSDRRLTIKKGAVK